MEHMREPEKSPAPSVIKANARAAPGGGLEWVLDAVVDASCKAWPPQLGPRRVRDIGGLGLNLYRGDLPAPVAVLREEALAANEEWMRLFLASTKTLLCPHGKTTMAPQLFARQIEHGAWGITMATRHQVGIARRAGVRKIILANEPVAMSDMQWIAAEIDRTPDLELYTYVDSVELVEAWSAVRRRHPGPPIGLLLEVGFTDGRTGARTVSDAVAVAEAVHAEPDLRLAGVAGFEGIIHGDAQMSALDRVRMFVNFMAYWRRRNCMAT